MKNYNRKVRFQFVPLGPVSSGTLKTADLLEAFIDALRDVRISRPERNNVKRAQAILDRAFEPDMEEAESALDDLRTIIENHVPPYAYFGPTEGDGAEIGVWVDMSAIADDIRQGYVAKGDQLPTGLRDDCPDRFLVVSDHGNCTLYRRLGNNWAEVWSIV